MKNLFANRIPKNAKEALFASKKTILTALTVFSAINIVSAQTTSSSTGPQDLNVSGNLQVMGAVNLPALGGSGGAVPVYITPTGNLTTLSGAGPFMQSTSCHSTYPWFIGGNTIGGTGMTDPSVGTCDDVPFGIKVNNTNRIYFSNSTGYFNNIGFGTTQPAERFHFSGGNILLDAVQPAGGLLNDFRLRVQGGDNPGLSIETTQSSDGNYNTKLVVNRNRTKAISVVNTVVDPITGYENFLVWGDGQTNVGWQPGSLNNAKLNINVVGGEAINVFDQLSTNVNFAVLGNGRTYIGKTRPLSTGPHQDAMLAVDGKLLAKEIYVNIHTSVWPDYVFESDYKLMSLNQVENYVQKNKHLPNIPSAKDLTGSDEYNLSLADMQKMQLEKIEELFLHVIKQQKEIDALKAKNAELEKQLNK